MVLSKLKEVPDTKKPDKFLIQATKIDPSIHDTDLPQLVKISIFFILYKIYLYKYKHNQSGKNENLNMIKKEEFMHIAVTIKCFQDTMEQKANENENEKENKNQNKNENNKHKLLNIIEDYVSSESTADSPPKRINTVPSLPSQTQSITSQSMNTHYHKHNHKQLLKLLVMFPLNQKWSNLWGTQRWRYIKSTKG